MGEKERYSYRVVPGKWFWFHWINVVCILFLVGLSFVMLYRGELGMMTFESKLALKKLHTMVGYVFILNLLVRFFWSVLQEPRGFFRGGRHHICLLLSIPKVFFSQNKFPMLGRSSYSRAVVTVLFILMFFSSFSGVYRAGTDLYYPPFGGLIKSYVAKPGSDPDELIPRHWKVRNQYVDKDRQKIVGGIGKIMGQIHRWSGYAIMVAAILHMVIVARMFIRRVPVASKS